MKTLLGFIMRNEYGGRNGYKLQIKVGVRDRTYKSFLFLALNQITKCYY